MIALTVRTDSYAYRFATVYSNMSDWSRQTDICQYTRYVIRGVLAWMFCMAIACGVGYGLGDMVAWIVAMLVSWQAIVPNEPAAITAGILVAITALITVAIVFSSLRDWQYRRAQERAATEQQEREPSFIREAYSAFKHKHCVPVTIVSPEK